MPFASRRQFLMTGLAAATALGAPPARAQDLEGEPYEGEFYGEEFASDDGPIRLRRGSGSFDVPGGPGREEATVGVRYFLPRRFTPDSPILLVIPGAGRRAGDYRDAWIPVAQRAGVLVAALNYPARDYDFAAYQMGGVIEDLEVANAPRPGRDGLPRHRAEVEDEDVLYDVNSDRESWLFADFDRVFRMLVEATGSNRTGYDIFGHSAGAQVVHRLVLFRPESKAERLVAANAGLYTLPTLREPPLTGLRGTGATRESLTRSFSRRLTILLGEEDTKAGEGTLRLSTPSIDRQGRNRFSRGEYFFHTAQNVARSIGARFNWRLRTVPGVGHDHERMSAAAGRYLYG